MRWLSALFGDPAPRLPHARPMEPGVPPFTCSTCGRTDLREAGNWDPPICLECDAAINFDAEAEEAHYFEEDEEEG